MILPVVFEAHVALYQNTKQNSSLFVLQISYLRNLGCTITPTSRLHASNLIEKYKSL